MKFSDLLKDAYQEGMSLEDIEKALENIEFPVDNSAEIERLKKALSNSNSEAADYKRQLREKMSAEELKAKEDADKWAEMEKKYNELLKKDTVSTYKAKFLGLGYDEKLATDTAEAMANGEMDKVFENQKKHNESVEKKIKSDLIAGTPKINGGNGNKTITKAEFDKMTYSERVKVFEENPDVYNEFTNGGNE
jgi:hypothetical protein